MAWGVQLCSRIYFHLVNSENLDSDSFLRSNVGHQPLLFRFVSSIKLPTSTKEDPFKNIIFVWKFFFV